MAESGESRTCSSADELKKIQPHQRKFILLSIAAYKTNEWIVKELRKRWGLQRSIWTIENEYRHNHVYKAQIEKYREVYNREAETHPAYSKRHMLDILYETMLEAKKDKDRKGVAAIAKQISDMVGHKAPSTVEHNHTVTGGLTYDNRIELIASGPKQEPPQTVIDIEANEVLPPLLEQRLKPNGG